MERKTGKNEAKEAVTEDTSRRTKDGRGWGTSTGGGWQCDEGEGEKGEGRWRGGAGGS